MQKALVVIFQASLGSGSIPENWKMANVKLLFKKGGREKQESLGLTSVIRKILQSITKDEIAEYLEVPGKIGLNQLSFIKGQSYLTCLEEVMSKLEKGEPVDVIYLDFLKTFDMVLHKRL
eukprot:g42541.t1